MSSNRLRSNEQGLVAIITTVVLMLVISLIVLGFTQAARRNQRQALDTQLSNQAFYAAESGVNLAKAKLEANANRSIEKLSCAPNSDFTAAEYQIDGTNTALTCLLIQPVEDLKFDSITSSSKVSLIQKANNTPVGSVYINWEISSGGGGNGCSSGSTQLPAFGAWTCGQPLLRVDLVPLQDNDVNAPSGGVYTSFLYPQTSGTPTSAYTAGNQGIVGATCNASISTYKTYRCSIQVTGLTAERYGIRMMSLYGDSRTQLSVPEGGGKANLVGGQVMVDSTARSIDVLKRVQVRLSLTRGGVVPDFAVMSGGDTYKQYSVNGTMVCEDTNPCATP